MAAVASPTRIGVAVVVYLFAAGVAWAMVTPIGAAPDEPAHIAYAAGAVRGDLGDITAVEHAYYTQLAAVTVPRWVGSIVDPPRSVDAYEYPCFQFDPRITADCAPTLSRDTEPALIPTTVTRYPPLYYWLVGWPTLVLAGEPAVYMMRIMSALLTATLIGLGLALASPSQRNWLALGVVIAFTPMAGHLAGSVNPSSMEIAASLGLGTALMGFDGLADRHRGRMLVGMALLSTAVAWSRPLTSLTFLAVVGASLIVNWNRLRWSRLPRAVAGMGTAAIAVIVASAAMFQILARHPVPALSGSDAVIRTPPFADVAGVGQTLSVVERRSIGWLADLIGRFGWVDHRPPTLVVIGWILLIGLLLLFAMTYGRRRDRTALGLVAFGALVAAPVVVTVKILNPNVYQARYHLPLAVLVVVASVAVLSCLTDSAAKKSAGRLLHRGSALASAGMMISAAASLSRYAVGGDPQLLDAVTVPFRSHAWWPPAGAVLVAVFAVGAGVLSVWTIRPSTPLDLIDSPPTTPAEL